MLLDNDYSDFYANKKCLISELTIGIGLPKMAIYICINNLNPKANENI